MPVRLSPPSPCAAVGAGETPALLSVPDDVYAAIMARCAPADLAALERVSREARARVRRAGWSRAHYVDQVLHTPAPVPAAAADWRALVRRRAELRAAAGQARPTAAAAHPDPARAARLLATGDYDAALVAMQPLPPPGRRSVSEADQLIAALRGQGRHAEASRAADAELPAARLHAAISHGTVAAVEAGLADGAPLLFAGADAAAQRLATPPEADESAGGAGAQIWRTVLTACVARGDLDAIALLLGRVAARHDALAPARADWVVGLALNVLPAAALRQEPLRGGGVALTQQLGSTLGEARYRALLAALPAPDPVPATLLTDAAAKRLSLAHVLALIEVWKLRPGSWPSISILWHLPLTELTAAGLARLRAVGVDPAARWHGMTILHVRCDGWDGPGGVDAMRALLGAGVDPCARDAFYDLALPAPESSAAAALLAAARRQQRAARLLGPRGLVARVTGHRTGRPQNACLLGVAVLLARWLFVVSPLASAGALWAIGIATLGAAGVGLARARAATA